MNLMPLSVFRKLGLGEVTPLIISLQLEKYISHRSLTYPRGVIKVVLVKVNKFIFLADFVVLDMEEDHDVALTLVRPFLATSKALIDVYSGELTLRVNEEEVIFNIYRSMKFPDEKAICHRIETIDDCVEKTQLSANPKDPLERCLTLSRTTTTQTERK